MARSRQCRDSSQSMVLVGCAQPPNNDTTKASLFEVVREGKGRVLLGSTPKMGEGTNVQKRFAALHHLEVFLKITRAGRNMRAEKSLRDFIRESVSRTATTEFAPACHPHSSL